MIETCHDFMKQQCFGKYLVKLDRRKGQKSSLGYASVNEERGVLLYPRECF